MKLSIVITYLNRQRQLINTLFSILHYKMDHELEIIIVDDGSDEENDISEFLTLVYPLPVKLIKLKRGFSEVVTAFNTAFNHITGDIVLINCAECMHMGPIIDYCFRHMYPKAYFNFGTYSINFELQEQFNKLDWNEAGAIIEAHKIISPTHSLPEKWKDGDTGWYVDLSPEHYSLLPFCAALNRSDLEELSGFDERFAEGIGHADTDFTIRLQNLGMHPRVVIDPFCVHQAHKATYYEPVKTALNQKLIAYLQGEYPKRTKADHNKIYLK